MKRVPSCLCVVAVLAGCVVHRPLESYSADELQAEYDSRKCPDYWEIAGDASNTLTSNHDRCLRERRELWEALQRRLDEDRATMPACVSAKPFPRGVVENAHAHTEAERLALILSKLLRPEEFRTRYEYQRCVMDICTWAGVRRINAPSCGKRS
jgi:hypothetical protein